MAIYDCILFNDENTILDIRLNELNQYVDYFVIIESKYTHQNKFKKKNIDINLLKKFERKIKYSFIDKNFDNFSSWQIENYQRNLIYEQLTNCNSEDIILVSDVDEIPNLKLIDFSKINNEIVAFRQLHTMYKFNLLRDANWIGTKLCKFKNLQSPQWLRNLKVHKKYPAYRLDKMFFSKTYYKNFKIIDNGGWHFGWLRDTKEILEKINNFAHTEYLKSKLNNKSYIKNCLINNVNFFNNKKLTNLDLSRLPKHIINNKKKYENFLKL